MKGGVTVGHDAHPHPESTRAKPECCSGYVMPQRHVHAKQVTGNHPKENACDYPGCKCVGFTWISCYLFLRGKDSQGYLSGGVTGTALSLNHEKQGAYVSDCGPGCFPLGTVR